MRLYGNPFRSKRESPKNLLPIEKRGGFSPRQAGPSPTKPPPKPSDAASSARPKPSYEVLMSYAKLTQRSLQLENVLQHLCDLIDKEYKHLAQPHELDLIKAAANDIRSEIL